MFRPMRRFKQQLPEAECVEILRSEPRGVLSLLGDDGYPYGLPMTHWYCPEDGRLYFHCAREGHKLDALRARDKASFCVLDRGVREPEGWAMHIRSVIVFGRIRVVEDPEKTEWILRSLTAKFTPDPAYAEEALRRGADRVLCLELIPEHITGKRIREA